MSHSEILIAEDDPNDTFLLHRVLMTTGLAERACFAKDGQEAIDLIREWKKSPRLLLLDLKMPRMNGFDVLRWIGERPTRSRFPVVILTSSELSPDIEKAYELGASSYLVKPPTLEGLEGLMTLLKQYWLEANRLPVAK